MLNSRPAKVKLEGEDELQGKLPVEETNNEPNSEEQTRRWGFLKPLTNKREQEEVKINSLIL
jgi:hypothetical protein